jgi:hypothetical protein
MKAITESLMDRAALVTAAGFSVDDARSLLPG